MTAKSYVLTHVLGILAAAVHLRGIVGLGERLLLTSQLLLGAVGGVVELKGLVEANQELLWSSLPWGDSEKPPA